MNKIYHKGTMYMLTLWFKSRVRVVWMLRHRIQPEAGNGPTRKKSLLEQETWVVWHFSHSFSPYIYLFFSTCCSVLLSNSYSCPYSPAFCPFSHSFKHNDLSSKQHHIKVLISLKRSPHFFCHAPLFVSKPVILFYYAIERYTRFSETFQI